MAKECTLVIHDEVNVRFENLEVATRRKISNKLKFFQEYARHSIAFKMGRWDGTKRYCDIGGRTYLNLIDVLLPIIQEDGYQLTIDDRRPKYNFEFVPVSNDFFSNSTWPKGHPCAGEPVVLRDHQVSAINTYLDNLQSISEIATGAGKSMMCAALAKKVELYGRSITIVPSKDLVTQTERDYKMVGLDVGVYFGDRKEPGHQHIICTWQSLEALDRKSKKYDPGLSIGEFVDDVVAVIADECHGTKATVLFDHLTSTLKNTPIRWGLTGTIPLDESDKVALIASVGPIISEITPEELQDIGVLSKLDIEVIQIQDLVLGFNTYQDELKYLVSEKSRLTYLSKFVEEQSKTGNTLILVSRIETGEELSRAIPGAVFVSGAMKSSKRKEEYAEIQTAENKVIIATFGVASTGIDIPRIFNLVLFEPGKSFIKVVQSIGRGIRTAKDKDYVRVFDVCSSAKYSKRHLTERKKYYKLKKYPFVVRKVDIGA